MRRARVCARSSGLPTRGSSPPFARRPRSSGLGYTLRGLDSKVLSAFTKTGSTYTWEDYIYRGQLLAGPRNLDPRHNGAEVESLDVG
jgi:hypothetical protein